MRRRCLRWLTAVWVILAAQATAAATPLSPGQNLFAGEVLHYRIRLGPATVGAARIRTRLVPDPASGTALEIRLTARSGPLLSALYPVRDRITSRATTSGWRTLQLDRRLREGNRQRVDHWRLDHDRGEALELELGKQRVAIPPGVHDTLSALWMLRTSHLASGDGFSVPVFLGPKTTDLGISVGPARQVTVPAGTFQCLPVRPNLGGIEPYDRNAGALIDLATGPGRYPVCVRLRLPVVGAISVELVRIATAE